MPLSNLAPTAHTKKLFPHPRRLLKQLPEMVAKPISYSPFFVQKVGLGKLQLKLFEESLAEGELDFLKGHWLKIDISDLGLAIQFSCGTQREVLIRKHGEADVCIRGGLKSFVFLAARKEDPDTLFFQRDLVIEGDTNIGLEVKNLLDSLDLEQLPAEMTFAMRCGAEYMDAFC